MCIDDNQLEEWPGFFLEDGFYEIVSRSNLLRGLTANAMSCQGQAMMVDRVVSLREANVYAEQCYRHMVSALQIRPQESGEIEVTSNYLVVRTLQLSGDAEIFSVGQSRDLLVETKHGLKLRRRRVIPDNDRVHSLLALPI